MYYPNLTSLRGVAAIVVVIFHCIGMFDAVVGIDDHTLPFTLNGGWITFHQIILMLFNGEASVVIFFLISGCVLTIQMDKLLTQSRFSTLIFWQRRILRIYPMAIVGCTIAMIVLTVARHNKTVVTLPLSVQNLHYLTTDFTFKDFIENLAILKVNISPPFWSLKVELFFSTAFPIIHALGKKRKNFVILLFISVFLMFSEIAPLTIRRALLCFVLGMALVRYPKLKPNLGLPEVHVFFISLLILMVTQRTLEPLNYNPGMYALPEALAAFMIVRMTLFKTINFNTLERPSLRFLGEISYSIYVLHFPIMWILTILIGDFTGGQMIATHPLILGPTLAAATLLTVLPISVLTYKWIELPCMIFGRRLDQLLTAKFPHTSLDHS